MVALSDEPDALDPTTARTLVGRTVFTSICEKLYDINAKLDIVPQLAADCRRPSADGKTVTIKLRSGIKFADGTPMDAAAVKTSLDRHLTLADLGPQERAEQRQRAWRSSDPSTVVLHLNAPFAPLIAQLADRAGMIMSPTALKSEGRQLRRATRSASGRSSSHSRVAQDHIEVVKDPNYYDASQGLPGQGRLQDHRRLDHPLQQPALRRRPGARRGRRHRCRRADRRTPTCRC